MEWVMKVRIFAVALLVTATMPASGVAGAESISGQTKLDPQSPDYELPQGDILEGTPEFDAFNSLPEQGSFVVGDSEDESTTTAVAIGSRNCYTRAFPPFKFDGYAKGLARTNCDGQVGYNEVYTRLYRLRVWGWDYLDEDLSGCSSCSKTVNSVSRWHCVGVGTYTYAIYGVHTVSYQGQTQRDYTRNEDRFRC
jgi:hypothetical protein